MQRRIKSVRGPSLATFGIKYIFLAKKICHGTKENFLNICIIVKIEMSNERILVSLPQMIGGGLICLAVVVSMASSVYLDKAWKGLGVKNGDG